MVLPKCISQHHVGTLEVLETFQTGHYGETYKVAIGKDEYVIKIIEDMDHRALEQVLAFLKYLNEEGMHVPKPLELNDNQLLRRVTYNNKSMVYYMYPLLKGHNLEDFIQQAIVSKLLINLGIELAKLHQEMSRYPKESLSHIKKWHEVEGLMVIYEDIQEEIPWEIIRDYEKNRVELERLNIDENQMIHNDLHMANILYQEDMQVFNFIDFDECVLGNRVMDIAILCFDLPVICPSPSLWPAGIADILTGYETIHPIDNKEKKAIPVMLKMLEIACYVNYYKYKDESDAWLQSFFNYRLDKILRQDPYLGKMEWPVD